MASLSAQLEQTDKNANDGARCSGGGSADACMTPRRPSRIDEDQPVEKWDLSGGADAAVEIVEIGAAAQRDVLAIVDVLAAGQHIGRSAAAQDRAAVRANGRGSRLQPARRPRKVPPARRRSRSRSSRTSASDHQPSRARSRMPRFFRRASGARARRKHRNRASSMRAQQAAVNPRQRPQRRAAVAMHQRNQARALARRNSRRVRLRTRSSSRTAGVTTPRASSSAEQPKRARSSAADRRGPAPDRRGRRAEYWSAERRCPAVRPVPARADRQSQTRAGR